MPLFWWSWFFVSVLGSCGDSVVSVSASLLACSAFCMHVALPLILCKCHLLKSASRKKVAGNSSAGPLQLNEISDCQKRYLQTHLFLQCLGLRTVNLR